MELKDIFPASKIFDPDIYYEGEVHLGDTLYIDNSNELTLNALMIKNKNAFLTFLEKNYYTYMRGIFNSESWDLKFSVVLRLGYNKQTDKRSIRFSLLNYLIEKMNLNVIEGVNYDHFNYAIYELKDDEELLECAREIARESRRRLQDILKNKYNSPYIKNIITDIMSRNEDYHNFNVIKKYAERGIEIFTDFLVISKRYLLPFFN